MESALTARADDEEALEAALKDLNAYPIPRALQYLYEWFCDLSACRGGNGYGPNPMGPSAIRDWAAMSGHRINPWEFGLLRAMDRKWLKVYAELNPPPKKPAPSRSNKMQQ